MKRFNKFFYAGLVTIGLSTNAMASDFTCDSGDKINWKNKDQGQAILVEDGYEIRNIKVAGGCHEYYAIKDGEKFEIFVNPASLKIVKIKKD